MQLKYWLDSIEFSYICIIYVLISLSIISLQCIVSQCLYTSSSFLCHLVAVLMRNVPYKLRHLETWSTSWGGSGSFRRQKLVEGSITWGGLWRIYRPISPPAHFLCFLHVFEDVSSQIYPLTAIPAACFHATKAYLYSSRIMSQNIHLTLIIGIRSWCSTTTTAPLWWVE